MTVHSELLAQIYALALSAPAAAAPLPPRVHGPLQAGAYPVSIKYAMPDGTRGCITVAHNRDALTRLAARVKPAWREFGGKSPARVSKPVTVRWPAAALKVWRLAIADRDFEGAKQLGAEKLGARFYQQKGHFAFCIAAPVPVDGMPDGIVTGLRCSGQWVAFDSVSGFSIGKASSSRAGAVESCRSQWSEYDPEKQVRALNSARAGSPGGASETQARDAWGFEST